MHIADGVLSLESTAVITAVSLFAFYKAIKTIKEQNVWLGVILDVIKIVEPKGVIIYGSLPNDLKNWFHLHNIDLYIYPSYMETRMKEVKQNGN